MTKRKSSKTVFFKFLFKPFLSVGAVCLLILVSPNARGADPDPSQKPDSELFGDEARLPGVFYDMKQTSDGMPTYLIDAQEGKQFNRMRTWLSVWNLPDTAGSESVLVPFLKRFVLSNWPYRTDSSGKVHFREFTNFSRSPVTPYRSYFYQPFLSSDTAPKTFSGDTGVSGAGWVGIHAGYVVAPFTGTFRFVGYGDDALVVRFDSQLVLDYGCYALSLGKKLDETWDYLAILSGTAARTDPQKRPVLDNPVYSRCKLERYSPSLFNNHGLAKGVPIKVTKGRRYPIEILVSDIESNQFGMALFIEELDSDGKPLKENPSRLPLFRTTSELPDHSGGSFPDFDEDSPVWNVVDSYGKPIAARKNQEEQPVAGNDDPEQKKNVNVTRTRQGNVTTETVVEYKGDTMIETVTSTEDKGGTTEQTRIMTETRNGVVEKRLTSSSEGVTVELFPVSVPANSKKDETPIASDSASGESSVASGSPALSSGSPATLSGESSAPSETKKETPPKTEKRNPFGYTIPPPEDD